MPALNSQQVAGEAPGVILSLLRYWRASLLVVLACAGLGYGVSLLLPEQYVATAELGLTDPRGSNLFSQGGGVLEVDLERYTDRQQSIVASTPTLERTRQRLDWDISLDKLYDRVSVTWNVAGVILVSGRGSTPRQA